MNSNFSQKYDRVVIRTDSLLVSLSLQFGEIWYTHQIDIFISSIDCFAKGISPCCV